ncbi:twin-arginine translocase subunit TatC [Sinisalibacter aestuarii]|uniref:Sec-independent protein translocase protein TatC n=1 Tax=Sinisalibacter aestuarii TaxID=2949426 RepID=A0ABQ5LT87_9RHOB|nr:twin-arginine translocase subunit TatC [Sinisalibacter aestuarii]GKY87828.1 Sec-independent protein translocase protein TatC [Sinisalibacter aestuarii]
MSRTEDEIEDSSAPLIEHLAELRTRLIRAVLAFVLAFVVAFIFAGTILDWLLIPIEASMRQLGNPNPVMQYTAPQEYFFTLVRIGMVGGLVLGFPFIANQLWRFVAPGLYKSEKAAFLPFLIASPAMFLAGGAFAHFIVTPLAMKFFLGFADASSLLTAILPDSTGETVEPAARQGIEIVFQGKVNETLDITLKLIVAFGLSFQLPVLLTLMGRAGLATSVGLAGMRKYAIVGILTLAAVVTPPDVITQVILFTVVYGLYEISIHLVRRFEKQREAQLRAEGLWVDPDEDVAAEEAEAKARAEAEAAAKDDPIFREFDDEEEADKAAEGEVWDIADDDDAKDGGKGDKG